MSDAKQEKVRPDEHYSSETSKLLAGGISAEFICKCGKQKGWIVENEETLPCPNCGRKYLGIYDKAKLTIVGKEVKLIVRGQPLAVEE